MRFKLTALQINWMDEVSMDKEAARKTLTVALNYHANRRAECDKNMHRLWKELSEIHGFDLGADIFHIRSIDGAVVVTDEPPEKDEEAK